MEVKTRKRNWVIQSMPAVADLKVGQKLVVEVEQSFKGGCVVSYKSGVSVGLRGALLIPSHRCKCVN